MPSSTETTAASPPATPLRRRKPMTMTPRKLRAQRANARLSTGPSTAAGRRRSALNRRKLELSELMTDELKRRGADLAEVRRLWHYVLAVFWFLDADCYHYLQSAAWLWWQKLHAVRRGGSEHYVKYAEAQSERRLRQAVERFAKSHQRWENLLRKEFGVDVQEEGIAPLRLAVESRMGAFRRMGRLQHPPPGGHHVENEPKTVSN